MRCHRENLHFSFPCVSKLTCSFTWDRALPSASVCGSVNARWRVTLFTSWLTGRSCLYIWTCLFVLLSGHVRVSLKLEMHSTARHRWAPLQPKALLDMELSSSHRRDFVKIEFHQVQMKIYINIYICCFHYPWPWGIRQSFITQSDHRPPQVDVRPGRWSCVQEEANVAPRSQISHRCELRWPQK